MLNVVIFEQKFLSRKIKIFMFFHHFFSLLIMPASEFLPSVKYWALNFGKIGTIIPILQMKILRNLN